MVEEKVLHQCKIKFNKKYKTKRIKAVKVMIVQTKDAVNIERHYKAYNKQDFKKNLNLINKQMNKELKT